MIKCLIHPSNPRSKSNEKISGLLDYIYFKCQLFYNPSKFVTIDERMISFRGVSQLIRYEKVNQLNWDSVHIFQLITARVILT